MRNGSQLPPYVWFTNRARPITRGSRRTWRRGHPLTELVTSMLNDSLGVRARLIRGALANLFACALPHVPTGKLALAHATVTGSHTTIQPNRLFGSRGYQALPDDNRLTLCNARQNLRISRRVVYAGPHVHLVVTGRLNTSHPEAPAAGS